MTQEKEGWQFAIPDTRIAMDGKPWPRGALTLAWMPEQDVGGAASKRSDELRIRASNLDLTAIEGLRSMAAKLSPDLQFFPARTIFCPGQKLFPSWVQWYKTDSLQTVPWHC